MDIKYGLKRLLRCMGFDLVRGETAGRQMLAPHLSRLFSQYGISCVLDVGANTGQYKKYLRDKVGYKGLVLSFEPIAENFEILKQKSQNDPNWEVYDFALGAVGATKVLNITANNVFSSFLTPDTSETPSFSDQNALERVETVQVRTFDGMMDELADKCPFGQTFMKLDTQGYDLEVVRGAEKFMSRVVAVQSEVSVRKLYKEIPSFVESHDFLSERGFDMTGLFPVSWDQHMRVIEFDVVMVNRALLNEVGSRS